MIFVNNTLKTAQTHGFFLDLKGEISEAKKATKRLLPHRKWLNDDISKKLDLIGGERFIYRLAKSSTPD